MEQSDKVFYVWGLTRASHGDITNGDDGHVKRTALQDSKIEERVPYSDSQSIYSDSNSYEYLHMNWGEDGDANGWFSGDNVAFSGYLYNTLIQFNYSSNRQDIINITPDDD